MGAVELINIWIAEGVLWPILAAPFVGSFCGVLIVRLPAGRNVVWSRSVCDTCGHALAVPDLVPIASYAALRGRCRHCQAPIGRTHLWVELAAVAVAFCTAATGQTGALLWATCALGWALLTLAWIDAACLRLPDAITLPLLVAGMAEAWWLEPDSLSARAFGAAIGYTLLWALAWAYRRLRGREGLGMGDAKLLAAGGAWVGAALLPDVLLFAALAGLGWALRRGRIDLGSRIPFGPFVALAIFGVWLFLV